MFLVKKKHINDLQHFNYDPKSPWQKLRDLDKVLFQKLLHCIHSNQVKKKQENREVKRSNSSRIQNIGCITTIHL